MRLQRLRFEFGMKLAAQIPGMIFQFANFDVHTVRSLARQSQSMLLQHCFIFAIELVTMTMALADFRLAVRASCDASFGEHAWIRAQSHGAAEFVDSF